MMRVHRNVTNQVILELVQALHIHLKKRCTLKLKNNDPALLQDPFLISSPVNSVRLGTKRT